MPDMIDLMKKGIKENVSSLMNSVKDMASDMSYTLNTEGLLNYAVSGSYGGNSYNPNTNGRDIASQLSSVDFNYNPQILLRLAVKVGAEDLFDDIIDYINDKRKRT